MPDPFRARRKPTVDTEAVSPQAAELARKAMPGDGDDDRGHGSEVSGREQSSSERSEQPRREPSSREPADPPRDDTTAPPSVSSQAAPTADQPRRRRGKRS